MQAEPETLDHLVVAARTLDEGAAWVRERLGEEPGGGGRHAIMGTRNRVLSLGGSRYLEVMAVDPEAAAPARPRWFSLDTEAMRARLALSPALVHWVARTADIEGEIRRRGGGEEILDMARGEFRWRIGVRPDGLMPPDGDPTWIQWQGLHPTERMPPSSCRLLAFMRPAPGGALRFATRAGEVAIPWMIVA